MLNKSMEKNDDAKPKLGHGGARPGAGRPKGSKNNLTIASLLEAVEKRSGGQSYEEMLVEDFMRARLEDDKNLIMKYHNLILQKVMNSLTKVEVTESQDAIEQKQQAFAEALAKIAGIETDK